MAVTGTGPTLGALTNGENAASAVTWGSGYATDTGTLAPESKQIRRGTNPWRIATATELVTTGQTVQFREVVSNTDFVGQAFATDVITVGAAAITAQTAYFGTATVSGQGGFKPVDAGGVDMDVLSIVSGGPTSPAAQVVDGRLSFAGTGAPNTATIRVETAEGEVDVTIATVPGKSIADPQHLAVALQAQVSSGSPIDLMLRPGAYDVNGGPNGSASSIANGIFHNRQIPEARRVTIKKHPSQTGEAYFYMAVAGRESKWFSTSWITIDGVNFRSITNSSQLITAGTVGTALQRTHNIVFKNIQASGPEVSTEDLNDPTPWTGVGYTGVLLTGFKMLGAYNITLEDVTFRNLNTGGDYNPEGLVMRRVRGENIYFDYMRIIPEDPVLPDVTAPVFEEVTATGFFAINNEISNTETSKAPHNDFFQIIGTELKYAVFIRCGLSRGPYRGDVVTPFQGNARINRALFHECVLSPQGVSWVFNSEGANYVLMNQSTFAARGIDATTRIRFGSTSTATRYSVGEFRLRNTYVGTNGVDVVVLENPSPTDPPVLVNENSYFPENATPSDVLAGPPNAGDYASGILALSPKAGSILDTNGIGALTTSGAFRGTEIPPMCGVAPSLGVSGSDVVITPSTSLYYDGEIAPTVWEWRHRTGNGAAWSAWTEEAGATATAIGLADTGRQFMYRWKAVVSGVAGVPSEVTAVA